jgi:hypothetical protein
LTENGTEGVPKEVVVERKRYAKVVDLTQVEGHAKEQVEFDVDLPQGKGRVKEQTEPDVDLPQGKGRVKERAELDVGSVNKEKSLVSDRQWGHEYNENGPVVKETGVYAAAFSEYVAESTDRCGAIVENTAVMRAPREALELGVSSCAVTAPDK